MQRDTCKKVDSYTKCKFFTFKTKHRNNNQKKFNVKKYY